MASRKGDNLGNVQALAIAIPVAVELDALDRLGPRARAVITNNPLKFCAAQLVIDVEAEAARRGQVWDLRHPQLDAMIANGITKDTFRVLRRDREEVDALAGLTPLRAKPGAERRGRRAYR